MKVRDFSDRERKLEKLKHKSVVDIFNEYIDEQIKKGRIVHYAGKYRWKEDAERLKKINERAIKILNKDFEKQRQRKLFWLYDLKVKF